MPIQFPSNATTGQTHQTGGQTWVYDGTAWTPILSGATGATGPSTNVAVYDEGNLVVNSLTAINFVGPAISANLVNGNVDVTVTATGTGSGGFSYANTAPVTAAPGDRWLHSDTLRELVYIDDGNSSQWIEPIAIGLTGATGPGANLSAVPSSIVPAANVAYDLGTSEQRWRDLYLSGNSIILGAATLSSTGSAINLPAGSTVGGGSIASGGDVATGGGPKITNLQVTDNSYTVLDDTAVDTAGGYIRITGTGFSAGCQVLINNIPATSTTFVSATEVRAQVPATAAGTYVVYLVNADGGVAIRVNGITFSATPTWVTGSALAGDVDSAISIQLSATSATTYTLQAGSTLPTGLTLSASGLISGTVTGLENDTSYSFTVVATDAENQDSPRTFTITITTRFDVARSLRFNRLDTAYLSRTISTSNRRTWTFSVWLKRAQLGLLFNIFNSSGSTPVDGFYFDTNDTIKYRSYNGSSETVQLITTQVFRDVAAWYHIVLAVDTTDSTAANRIKLYINGSQVTAFSTSTYPAQNFDTGVNLSGLLEIGSYAATNTFAGYMAEVNFIDGLALTPTSFAKTDATTGQWVPKRFYGTFGTNGFYLNFADNSNTTAATLGKDSSGNNNNWTPNNFSVAAGADNDSLLDSPTNYGTDTGLGGEVRGNYCVLNHLKKGYSSDVYNNGSLEVVGGFAYPNYFGTISVTSGKWYYEVVCTQTYSSAVWVGWINGKFDKAIGVSIGSGLNQYISNGSQINYTGTARLVNDVVGCAADLDNNTVNFYRNGVAQGSISYTFSNDTWLPWGSGGGGYGAGDRATLNFGQRPFAYAAPSGYKVLCSTNLPTPVAQSNTAFDAVAYTGNGTARSITGFNFSPDLAWIKARSSSSWWHQLQDTVRGATKRLASNDIGVEVTDATTLTSFNSDGFSLGTSTSYNENATTYIAWAWDAGTATVTNNSGSIASQVRANPAAGFSIVSYASGSSGDKTVGHGLGQTPRFIITKTRNGSTYNWSIYHVKSSTALTQFLRFTTDSIVTSGTNIWGSAFPTSSVFGITSGNGVEANTDCIAYCFAEVPGFSAFGSYTGNGSADGPFVYTGFRPRFILLKSSSVAATNWQINDTTRDTYNIANKRLSPSTADAEATTFNFGDILSNGFKIRQTDQTWNSNGGTYIYAAFAEQPFKYSRAR
jgi:hypothetical protein